jgi:hypothetical protein
LNIKALLGVARMFEGIICGFLIFAIGYAALMRQMARRADVLHGEFIQRDGFQRPVAQSWFAMILRYLPAVRLPVQR